jgi:hypothetical protein
MRSLLNKLQWFWDLSAADATITDRHSGLSLTREGSPTTNATGGPDGGACINFSNERFLADNVAPIDYAAGFTVNIWVRSTLSSSTGNWAIAHRGTADSANPGHFQVNVRSSTGNTDRINTLDNVSAFRTAFAPQEALNIWQMVTMRDTGPFNEFYRNGRLLARSDTVLGARSTDSARFAIGSGSWWLLSSLLSHQGQLAMAGVWAEPLTEKQILALYNGGRGLRYDDLNVRSRQRSYFYAALAEPPTPTFKPYWRQSPQLSTAGVIG